MVCVDGDLRATAFEFEFEFEGLLPQVKSRCREVALHKDSPLSDAVLECYASGNRNVFALGFVPVKSENTVRRRHERCPSTNCTLTTIQRVLGF